MQGNVCAWQRMDPQHGPPQTEPHPCPSSASFIPTCSIEFAPAGSATIRPFSSISFLHGEFGESWQDTQLFIFFVANKKGEAELFDLDDGVCSPIDSNCFPHTLKTFHWVTLLLRSRQEHEQSSNCPTRATSAKGEFSWHWYSYNYL